MELLWLIEERYPVARWRVGTIHVWPLIRKNLAEALRAVSLETGDAIGRLRRAFRGLISQERAAIVDRAHNARIGSADVLFQSNAACRSLVQGHWLDRLCDPLREQLELQHCQCLQLELAVQNQYRVPRWRSSRLIQRDVLWHHLLSRFRASPLSAADICLPGFDNLLCDLAQHGAPARYLDRGKLYQQCAVISGLASYFKRILIQTQARLVIVVCYYGQTGFALNLAARQLGVPSVDLQHGVQGSLHFAYGPWTALPDDGYALLPDRFWCWSQQDAAQISDWGASAAPRHTAFVGGNPWANYWSLNDPPGAASVREQLIACKARLGGSRHILISLQWGASATNGFPPELAGCLAAAPEDWRWWVRLHPADTASRRTLPAWLSTLPEDRVEWRTASELPLPLLLPMLDAHVTRSSSVVQEAAALGIPSVVTDAAGMEYYRTETAAGLVQYAQNPADILSALAMLMREGKAKCGPTQVLPWELVLSRLRAATGFT